MKFIDEYRDAAQVKALAGELTQIAKHPWIIMEICGGQTHSFMHYGIDQLLPGDDRAGAWTGLPGLRDPARNDR